MFRIMRLETNVFQKNLKSSESEAIYIKFFESPSKYCIH